MDSVMAYTGSAGKECLLRRRVPEALDGQCRGERQASGTTGIMNGISICCVKLTMRTCTYRIAAKFAAGFAIGAPAWSR